MQRGSGDALPRRLTAAADRVEIAWRAPGRANLIGDHTDYNDGLCLPVALSLATYVAGRRLAEPRLRLCSLDEPGEVIVDLASGAGPDDGWGLYARAVVRALRDGGVTVAGFEGVVASDVPIGAGLSSSAAFEVAVASALVDAPLAPLELARLMRRAENDHVGAQTGILDQLACAASEEDTVLFIDCRDERYRHVPWPRDLEILLVDSAVAHSHGSSGYNDRRRECERAREELGVESLRDVGLGDLDGRDGLDDVLLRRVRHVVTENERVIATVRALEQSDLGALAPLFADSHASLSRDYEVSTPEVDRLVEVASDTEGVLGARLTGGGFGGCVVCLVAGGSGQRCGTEIAGRYGRATGLEARFWVSPASAGAERVR
ncbi:galactokinase [soil metagenome]